MLQSAMSVYNTHTFQADFLQVDKMTTTSITMYLSDICWNAQWMILTTTFDDFPKNSILRSLFKFSYNFIH